jgi:shikimate dehydrogenase
MQLPTGASRVVFILAHPAGHVSAPRYYSPYFRENGLDWHMVPMDVAPQDFSEMVRILSRSGSVVGFNLTMPHKPAAFAMCDAVGPAATFEGAGFLNAARAEGVFNPDRRCVVFGAGGAGRAICHALAAAGVRRLGILNETSAPVEALAAKLRVKFEGLDIRFDESFDDAGLFVNATPLGLHACDPMPVVPAKLPKDCAVFDIIAARRTEFMDAAAARGLKVAGGVAMIKHQLPLQTAFWRGEAL